MRTIGDLALFRTRTESEPIVQAGKPLVVVVYLAMAPGGKAERDRVAQLLWPGPGPLAHQSLRQSVYRLKNVIGAPLIRLSGNEIRLNAPVRLDCLEGELAADAGEIEQVCELLNGNFLESFAVPESREFEEWAEGQRSRFRDVWARAAAAVAERELAAGETEKALALSELLCDRRPFDEEPVQLLVKTLARLGRHATALARLRSFTDQLASECGEEPSLELRRSAEEIESYLKSCPSPAAAELPFAGRAAEWNELENAWNAAGAGHGSSVLIEGAAGLGKSRMLAELARKAEAERGLLLHAKCYEIEQGVPYSALAQALAASIGRPEVEELSAAWIAELARVLPELRERFARLPEPRPSDGVEAAKRRLHEAIARYVEALAAERPVLLAVDDIHWSDAPSLEALHFLTHRLSSAKVLLVATYRPAELTPVSRRFARSACAAHLARLVVLKELSVGDVEQLLGLMGCFEDAGLAGTVARYLHGHSGGNPLFLSELLDALARSKLLAVSAGQWQISERETTIAELPKTLGKLLADRIDALAPALRAFVEALAVGAEELALETLAVALDVSEPNAELALSLLEEERLVRRVGSGTFALAHDELRRLAYQGIPDERRRLLHGALGHTIELRGGAKRPGGASRLAHHFDQASAPERAHHYALIAAEEAGVLGGTSEREAHLELAAAHSPGALPPSATRFAVRSVRISKMKVVVAAMLVVVLAGGTLGGGMYLGSRSRSFPDYRQGVLYLGLDPTAGPTHRLNWPSAEGRLARVEAFEEPPDGFPPRLTTIQVNQAGETHNKTFMIVGADTTQLTSGRTDDMLPPDPWSPDGRFFVLPRGQRVSATRYSQNLHLLDRSGKVVREVTRTDWQDGHPDWSPLGTQLAFNRDSAGTSAIWVVDFDGENARNVTAQYGLPSALGRPAFSPDGRKLAVVYPDTGANVGAIYVVDFDLATARGLPGSRRSLSSNPSWSPDGRWLASVSLLENHAEVWVERSDGLGAPVLAARLPPASYSPMWIDEFSHYITELTVQPRTLSLVVGQGVQVSARVMNAAGDSVSVPLRWFTRDGGVARTDEMGFVRGRGPGTTTLIASAGGFVADTVAVQVAFAPVDTLLEETWESGLDSAKWTTVGEPKPKVVRTSLPERRNVFLNNGDYNHASGAVSLDGFAVKPGGLTLEAEAWLELTGQHWQHWQLGLADYPAVSSSELVYGPVELHIMGPSPTVEGQIGCGRERVPVDLATMNQRWLRVALQIRPDGFAECVIDGKVIARTALPESDRNGRYSFHLSGMSVATRIYHGRLVVTRGLRY